MGFLEDDLDEMARLEHSQICSQKHHTRDKMLSRAQVAVKSKEAPMKKPTIKSVNKGDFMKEFEIIVPADTGQAAVINELAKQCHEANAKWWHDPSSGLPILRNKGEMLMLMVSELAECLEGERKSLMDDKLPHRRMPEVELADCIIRILDYAAGHGYDVGGAFVEKMAYNATRKDHTHEERLKPGGKKF